MGTGKFLISNKYYDCSITKFRKEGGKIYEVLGDAPPDYECTFPYRLYLKTIRDPFHPKNVGVTTIGSYEYKTSIEPEMVLKILELDEIDKNPEKKREFELNKKREVLAKKYLESLSDDEIDKLYEEIK